MDGDGEFPTICGTGTEDYFGGAWDFEWPIGQYGVFSTPFLGLPQVIKPDGLYRSQMRFGMYRWHVMDPIRFEQDLRVTIQALGWRVLQSGQARYLPLQAETSSTALRYQREPHAPLPKLPDRNCLLVLGKHCQIEPLPVVLQLLRCPVPVDFLPGQLVVAAQVREEHVLGDRLIQALIAVIERDPQPVCGPVGKRLVHRQAVEDQGIADRVVRRHPRTDQALRADG